MRKTTRRTIESIALTFILMLMLVGCGEQTPASTTSPASVSTDNNTSSPISDSPITEADVSLELGKWDDGTNFGELNKTTISLSDNDITIQGDGATASGSTVTINAEGVYEISGTLTNGNIYVEAEDAHVELILNGVSITSDSSSPIHIEDVKKALIWLADGSTNTLISTATDTSTDEESVKCAGIFSKDDLTVNGSGTLSITSATCGINCKETLKVANGSISLNTEGNGLRGRDAVGIFGGSLTITCGNDGIKSVTEDETTEGYVAIYGGDIRITATGDGIHGEHMVYVENASLNLTAGGGAAETTKKHSDSMKPGFGFDFDNSDNSDGTSSKGLKSDNAIYISQSTITMDCADDTIHSDGTVAIYSGTLTLASGDDGIHAGSKLEISGGDYEITESYEGLEALSITISGGNGSITASDDGLNCNGEEAFGFGGSNQSSDDSSTSLLSITGGTLYVNAAGDGLDSNGSINMSGGTVLVEGPTDSANGPLDYATSFTMTGGVLVATGSSGMAEGVSASGINALQVFYTSTQSAGTMLSITDANNNVILTFTPSKNYENLVFCAPSLVTGEYNLNSGGSTSGDGGWHTMTTTGTISGATKLCSVTISESVTTISSDGSAHSQTSGFNGGGFNGGGNGGGNRPDKGNNNDFNGGTRPSLPDDFDGTLPDNFDGTVPDGFNGGNMTPPDQNGGNNNGGWN